MCPEQPLQHLAKRTAAACKEWHWDGCLLHALAQTVLFQQVLHRLQLVARVP